MGRDFIEELKTIHYMFRYFLDRKKYNFVSTMMDQFDETSDINEIKTILIITSSFKNNEILNEPIDRLQKIFDEKNKGYK